MKSDTPMTDDEFSDAIKQLDAKAMGLRVSDINEADLAALLEELRDQAANGYKTCQYAALRALVAERDALRREVCELVSSDRFVYDSPEEISVKRGWDCFKEGGGA